MMIMSMLLAASLNQLYSMLNGLQMTTHLPVFRLKVPSNATYFLNFLIEVSTFDPLPIEAIWAVFPFPQKAPYDDAFDAAGYNYIYAIENFGTGTVMIHAFIFMMAICGMLWCTKPSNKVYTPLFKLYRFLSFGAFLLLFYEGYLEMSISLFIGAFNMEWSAELGRSVLYSNFFTLSICIIILLLPIFICVYYTLYVDALHEDEFSSRYGALYEGLKIEDREDQLYNRTITMLFPLFFVLRRLIFCFAAIFLAQWPALQLLVLFYVTTLMIIYLMWYKPFEENFYTGIEVLNEITVIFLLYFMMMFTEWIPQAEQRYFLAWFFIFIVSLNVSIHLFFLAKGVFD